MSKADRIIAKAITPESRSEAIVVSFAAEWYDRLRNKSFNSVIRKRVPKGIKPRWLYFHVNAPRSAICACAEILSVETVDINKAICIGKSLDLTENEIRNYIGNMQSVGCYHLGKVKFPRKDIPISELVARMVYYAPQSFFVLSKNAKELLNRLFDFF